MIDTTTKDLVTLLDGIDHRTSAAVDTVQVNGITSDSRQVRQGDLFVAVSGQSADGHCFVAEAAARGCAAIIIEDHHAASLLAKVSPRPVIIEVTDSRLALGLTAAAFYNHPGRQLFIIGITGTNGKTTCSYLVESILQAAGYNCGVIGTINYRYHTDQGQYLESTAPYTTPEPTDLQEILGRMRDSGVSHVIMEVSSHALAQDRLAGLAFDVAAFTNLSRDHLDFHGTMEDYFDSKKKLFSNHMKPEGVAVVTLSTTAKNTAVDASAESCWGQRLSADIGSSRLIRCGQEPNCDVRPLDFAFDFSGITAAIAIPVGTIQLHCPLVGLYNLRNLLTAIGIGLATLKQRNGSTMGERIRTGLEAVPVIPGRLERIRNASGTDGTGRLVFVDYAHTPDALDNVLTTLRQLGPRRLICVFGCGGDRDAGKRPLMGEAAGRLADVVLATSDNPRSEPPERILAEIEVGLHRTGLQRGTAIDILRQKTGQGYDIIVARREAIRLAIRYSRNGDVVLISGKGHEDYQITGTTKTFFDDRLEAGKHLAMIH